MLFACAPGRILWPTAFQVKRTFPEVATTLPPFPPKKLFGSMSPEVVNKRRDALGNSCRSTLTLTRTISTIRNHSSYAGRISSGVGYSGDHVASFLNP